MNTQPQETINHETTEQVELGNPWQVVLFNDEEHSFDEVILQIQKATGYALERAVQLTIRVHEKGKALIYVGSKEKCEKVGVVLQQIQLIVLIEKT
jgi:ATP-dependent Clp protease adaptor protein ClpS